MTININYNIMVQENKKLDKRYIKAKKRIDDLKEFYIHLITFIVMNAFLIFVNYVTYWEYKWFWYSLFGWGIGLVMHFFVTFGYGPDWEERKIKEFMEKDNRK